MKNILSVAALLTVGLMLPAQAADMAARPYTKAPAPVVSVYNWTGFYIGANGGYGSSHKCWDFNPVPGILIPEGCHNATGGTIGGQVGYRWQASNVVFGLEAQGNWADFRGSNITLIPGPPFENVSRINAFGLFTGQVGLAWNSVLLYVKGGAAVVSDRFNVNLTNVLVATTPDSTRWGATVGAGAEFGFAPNWSVAFEYDHIFLPDRTHNFTDTFGFPFSIERIRQDVDLVTVRVNYRFGGPVVAKY